MLCFEAMNGMHMSKPSIGIQILMQEHQNLGTVLGCLKCASTQVALGQGAFNADLFTAAFDYVEEYLNTFHHPKENMYLFMALRLRRPDLVGLLDQLESQHAVGEVVLDRARVVTKQYQEDGDSVAFKDAIDRYCQFEWDHMQLEEEEIIPAAIESLTEPDLRTLDQAFTNNEDPIFSNARKDKFDQLIVYISDNMMKE